LFFRRIAVQSFVPIFAMDVEKLANPLQERRMLWDFRIKLYDNEDVPKRHEV
jgi:hypothetical protein